MHTWTAIDRFIKYGNLIFNKIKREFFKTFTISVLLYNYTNEHFSEKA